MHFGVRPVTIMLRPELKTYPAEDVFLICKVGLISVTYFKRLPWHVKVSGTEQMLHKHQFLSFLSSPFLFAGGRSHIICGLRGVVVPRGAESSYKMSTLVLTGSLSLPITSPIPPHCWRCVRRIKWKLKQKLNLSSLITMTTKTRLQLKMTRDLLATHLFHV